MRNLWNIIPPPQSDNHGFLEVIKGSDGCGIIDDGGAFRTGGHGGRGKPEGGGRGGEFHGHGRPEGGRGRGGQGSRGIESRVLVSNIDNEDVIVGTREKVLGAFKEANRLLNPTFVLFSSGPCGGMIGTDLDEIADTVSAEYDIPAAVVNLSGQNTYDVGISTTTLVLTKLLAKDCTGEKAGINILGATPHDWDKEDLENIKAVFSDAGYPVIAQPGGQFTAAQMRNMGNAKMNIAATRAGLETARYLNGAFGTPFIAMAPFGEENLKLAVKAVEEGGMDTPSDPESPADALIISEQFIGNAVRETLERSGVIKSGDVATLFRLDKVFARVNDRRLRGEDDIREFVNDPQYKIIAADPILKPFLQRECKWIDLPHRAQSGYSEGVSVPLIGGRLNKWLEEHI
ncbi:MAG: nitrogenase component 1 [Oscillospiraceae bacterium]